MDELFYQVLKNRIKWSRDRWKKYVLEIRSMERGICPIAVLFCIKTRSFFNI